MHTFSKALVVIQVIISGGIVAVNYLAERGDIWNVLQLYMVYILLFIAALNFLGLVVDLIAKRRKAG